MLSPELVSKVIDELEKQESYAPYEKKLLDALRSWLQNFTRRKYT